MKKNLTQQEIYITFVKQLIFNKKTMKQNSTHNVSNLPTNVGQSWFTIKGQDCRKFRVLNKM